QIQTVERVAWDEASDFVERGKRIERTEARLKPVGREPYRLAIGFAGLRAARLAQVTANSRFAEVDQRLDGRAHFRGKAHENLKIRLDAGNVGALAHHLHVAECVGDSPAFF